jgi:hypothetical protein
LLGLKVFDALLNYFEDFNFVAYVIVHYYNLLVAVILFITDLFFLYFLLINLHLNPQFDYYIALNYYSYFPCLCLQPHFSTNLAILYN